MNEQPFEPANPDLIEAYLLGQLDHDSVQALDAALRADPQLLQQFAESAEIMSMVRESFHGQAEQDTIQSAKPILENFDRLFAELLKAEREAEAVLVQISPDCFEHARGDRSILRKFGSTATDIASRPKSWITVAAIFVVGMSLALVLSSGILSQNPPRNTAQTPIPKAAVVARLTAVNSAIWTESSPKVGDELLAGQRLILEQGFAEITTARGAVAILEAPATIELLDNHNALRLHTGKLVGICETESSKGFVVKTDYANITDLSTEFAVHAHATGVETTVFTGEVVIETPAGMHQRIKANKTARLTVRGNTRELVVEDRVAAGFDAIRDQQLASITMPRLGTGVGYAINEYDPRYRITAIDDKPLDSPLPLRVSGFTADKPDKFAGTKMLLHNPTHGRSNSAYRIETTLQLPVSFDPDKEQLVMWFAADNVLLAMRVNGQDASVPKQNTLEYALAHALTIDVPLKPGANAITFDVRNDGANTRENPVGLQVAWELKPITPEQTQPIP